MDRLRMAAWCLIIMLAFGGSWVIAAQDSEDKLCIPVESITLKAPESVEAKRAEVEFPHSVHFDYNCKTCHHKWENDANLTGCMTSGCHDLAQSPKKAKSRIVDPKAVMKYYKTAYHNKCIGCHKQIKMKNEALAASGKVLKDKLPNTGPTSCKGCHPKEE